jgi:biotin transport system substrate-specific component
MQPVAPTAPTVRIEPGAPVRPASQGARSMQVRLARRAVTVLLGSMLVAVCAHVSIPLWFTPVPVTLQTFAVLFLGLILGPGMAASTLALYLLEGMAGLPVFSPVVPSGLLHLLGPTGGYLLSYPAAAALTAVLRSRRTGSSGFATSLLAATAGSLLILVAGACWFAVLTHSPVGTVMALAVTPFLAGDVLKTIAAAGTAFGWRRFFRS